MTLSSSEMVSFIHSFPLTSRQCLWVQGHVKDWGILIYLKGVGLKGGSDNGLYSQYLA